MEKNAQAVKRRPFTTVIKFALSGLSDYIDAAYCKPWPHSLYTPFNIIHSLFFLVLSFFFSRLLFNVVSKVESINTA